MHRNWQATVRPHWTQIVLAAGLVVVRAAQVLIYIRQAEIMGAQASIAMTANGFTAAVQRAFVYSPGITLTGYSAQNSAVVWTFAAEWRNSGNTRTKNLTIDLNCWDEATSIMDHPSAMISAVEY